MSFRLDQPPTTLVTAGTGDFQQFGLSHRHHNPHSAIFCLGSRTLHAGVKKSREMIPSELLQGARFEMGFELLDRDRLVEEIALNAQSK